MTARPKKSPTLGGALLFVMRLFRGQKVMAFEKACQNIHQ